MACLLLKQHCTVTIAHSRTVDLPAVCKSADILVAAARHCAPLKAALDTWGEVTFDYASTDTLDTVPTPTSI